MTTPRDLMITAIDESPDDLVQQGGLSLALAAAELVDLLDSRAVTLDGEVIVPNEHLLAPGGAVLFDDPLLARAAGSLDRNKPYESVKDWLWRRGRGLAAAYAATLADDGQVTRRRRRWIPVGGDLVVVADSADHRSARARWTAHEPVLTALATSAGLLPKDLDAPSATHDAAVATVLSALDDASSELEAAQQQLAVEEPGHDTLWRAP